MNHNKDDAESSFDVRNLSDIKYRDSESDSDTSSTSNTSVTESHSRNIVMPPNKLRGERSQEYVSSKSNPEWKGRINQQRQKRINVLQSSKALTKRQICIRTTMMTSTIFTKQSCITHQDKLVPQLQRQSPPSTKTHKVNKSQSGHPEKTMSREQKGSFNKLLAVRTVLQHWMTRKPLINRGQHPNPLF